MFGTWLAIIDPVDPPLVPDLDGESAGHAL